MKVLPTASRRGAVIHLARPSMCVDLQVRVFWVGGGGGVILCVCSKCACVCVHGVVCAQCWCLCLSVCTCGCMGVWECVRVGMRVEGSLAIYRLEWACSS